MIFIRFPFKTDIKALDYGGNPPVSLIRPKIEFYLQYDQFKLFCNGKLLQDSDIIPDDSTVQVTFSLPGGKGGFGSMLRAIGAQIEKTTNREACRDLSGRRLRDINEEQRLKKWIAKEAEREAKKIRRRKERIERLKTKAPHKFFDFEYEKEISELPERINEALNEGLQNAKQPAKRPLEKPEKPVKKTWLADVLSSDSESDDATSAANGSPSKKQKVAQTVTSSCDSDISESSQSLPGSSKDNSFVFDESSASCDSRTALIEKKSGASQSFPSSSKDRNFTFYENSTPCDSETALTENKNGDNSLMHSDINTQEDQSNSNDIKELEHDENTNASSISEPRMLDSAENTMDMNVKGAASPSDVKVLPSGGNNLENGTTDAIEVEKTANKDMIVQSKSDESSDKKDPEVNDDSPIDLFDFQSVSELEALGLERLKFALMARGLKCGGTLSDRAQRLWKVRGLQPHEYPANLLAKKKK